jgi:predicted small lipoprotein YifL
MLRPVRSLAPALVLLVLAGCGDAGPTPDEQVRSAVGDFGRATAAKDYRTLCEDILAPQLVDKVTEVGLPCESALRQGLGRVREPHLTIGRVQVDGDRASAEIRTSAAGEQPSKDTLKLVKVNGTWKISSLGS